MTVSRYIHASANDTISFHFYGRVTFHYIYIPHLYPFLCWWTLRLLPCPGCYKHHCNEHWGAWCWKCKLIQPMWRTVWRFLTKLKIQVPYDPAIPLLGICLEIQGREFSPLLYREGKRDTQDPMTCRSSYCQWMEEWQSTATRHFHWSTVGVTQLLPHLTCPTVSAPVFQDREECTSSSPRFTIPTGSLLWDTHFKSNTRLSGVWTMASDILKMHFFPFLCHWQYSVPWSTMTKRSRKYCSQSAQFTQLCPTLCDPMDCSMPGFPVHHQLPEPTQNLVCWVCDAIQPSHPLFLLPSIFLSIRVFSNEPVLHIRWPSTGVSTSASVLPMNIQDWFPLGWTIWSPCCPRDSWESSPIPQFKSINSSALSLFMFQLSHLYMNTGKSIALTRQTFCQQSDVSAF